MERERVEREKMVMEDWQIDGNTGKNSKQKRERDGTAQRKDAHIEMHRSIHLLIQ